MRGTGPGAFAPLRRRGYRVFFIAKALSATGNSVAVIASAFTALGIRNSASDLGWVLAAGLVPQLVLVLPGGAVGDRLSRSTILVGGNAILGTTQAVTAGLALTHTVQVWHLVVLAALTGSVGAFSGPAGSALVPQLVAKDERQQANALLQSVLNGIKVAGPVVAGLVVATVGPGWALAYDAVTFFGAVLIFATLRVPAASPGRQRFGSDMKAGWLEFCSHRWLWAMTIQGSVVIGCWLTGFMLLGPVYAATELNGAKAWGAISSAFTIGMLLGSSGAVWWRPSRPGWIFGLDAVALSLPLAAMGAHLPLPAIVGAAAATGLTLSTSVISYQTLVQDRIDPARLSRVKSYTQLGETILVPIGYLIAGPAADQFGVTNVLTSSAILMAISAVLLLAVPDVRWLRTTQHTEHSPPKESVEVPT